MHWLLKVWYGPGTTTERGDAKELPITIHSWLERKRGKPVDQKPCLKVDDILAAASFAALDKTPAYYRSVARSLREHGFYKEAKQYFETTLSLEQTNSLAMKGLAKTYFKLKDYEQAIQVSEKALETVWENNSDSYNASLDWKLYKFMAESYVALEKLESHPSENSLDMDKKACEYFSKASSLTSVYFDSLYACVSYWHTWAMEGLYPITETKYTTKNDLPHPSICFREIVDMAHEVDDACSRHRGKSYYSHWLWNDSDDYRDFENRLAIAASETGRLAWLEQCYHTALNEAREALRITTAAKLALGLACLYNKYIRNQQKAVRLWESLAFQGSFALANMSTIAKVGKSANASLLHVYTDEAQKWGKMPNPWVDKMEKLRERSVR
jgi:tetratricopeptide (TPR) repeat protein